MAMRRQDCRRGKLKLAPQGNPQRCGRIRETILDMLKRVVFLAALLTAAAAAQTAGPAAWQNDLTPINAADWNYDFAAHLLERAGFGGTPAEIDALAKMTPAQAIARLVRFEGTDASQLPPFDHSGVHDPGLEPFPPSRPAVTDMAKQKGEALGT